MGELLQAVDSALAGAWRRNSVIHGEAHWWCVAATGLDLLDDHPGADAELVLLFGLLHDTRRENDYVDPGHGHRAAAHARELQAAGALALAGPRLDLLCEALSLHPDGLVSDELTVAVCWDADRLHLPRCGIEPDPARFSTSTARQRRASADAARRRECSPDWTSLLRRVDDQPSRRNAIRTASTSTPSRR